MSGCTATLPLSGYHAEQVVEGIWLMFPQTQLNKLGESETRHTWNRAGGGFQPCTCILRVVQLSPVDQGEPDEYRGERG